MSYNNNNMSFEDLLPLMMMNNLNPRSPPHQSLWTLSGPLKRCPRMSPLRGLLPR